MNISDYSTRPLKLKFTDCTPGDMFELDSEYYMVITEIIETSEYEDPMVGYDIKAVNIYNGEVIHVDGDTIVTVLNASVVINKPYADGECRFTEQQQCPVEGGPSDG